jgi:hypothetical protein
MRCRTQMFPYASDVCATDSMHPCSMTTKVYCPKDTLVLDARWADIIMNEMINDESGVLYAGRCSRSHGLREVCAFFMHKFAPYATDNAKKFKGVKLPPRAINWGAYGDALREKVRNAKHGNRSKSSFTVATVASSSYRGP